MKRDLTKVVKSYSCQMGPQLQTARLLLTVDNRLFRQHRGHCLYARQALDRIDFKMLKVKMSPQSGKICT